MQNFVVPKTYFDFVKEITSDELYRGLMMHGLFASFSISGGVSFTSSSGQTWIANFDKPAKQNVYYKGYVARLKVTIETKSWVGYSLECGSIWQWDINKVLYTSMNTYVCECTC